MKKWTVPVFFLLLYTLPYAFLAMYGDHALGTAALYAPMAAAFSALCFLSIRRGQGGVVVLGNLLSFLSSRAFLLRWQEEGWETCFRPFSPMGFLTAVSAIALGAQLLWMFFDRRKRAAFSEGPAPKSR